MRIYLAISLNALTALCGVNLIMFFFPQVVSFILRDVDQIYGVLLYLLGGLDSAWVMRDLQPWRLITWSYLHADIIHLAANMFALLQIGRIVYSFYGGKMLFVFYTLTGIGGGLATILLWPGVQSVGASAAVFGLVGVLVAESAKQSPSSLQVPFDLRDALPIFLYTIIFSLGGGVAINHLAHIAGFASGLVLGYIFDHRINFARKRWQNTAETVLFRLTFLLTLAGFTAMLVSIPQQLLLIS